ncbi:MAG: hypothetical protein ACXVEF_12800 [Polyangiales bacterium]
MRPRFVFDSDKASNAIYALSPAMKQLREMKSPGGNIGGMYGDEPVDCAASDPACAWSESVGIHHPDRFETWEWCSVHAYTGEVKCGEPPVTVGYAMPDGGTAASDAGVAK